MIHLIVDSTVDLTEEQKKNFTVVPLTVHFGQEEYVDGVDMSHREFYEKLVESDVLPTTSQAAPAAFAAVFAPIAQAGDSAVVLTLSAKLSGTCQSAAIAAADYPGRIFVVDSHSVAIGAGALAMRAVELRDQGLSAREIADALTRERDKVRIVALLNTLEYLKKGGRISATAAIAGALLSIKPVIAVDDGEIRVLGKARGSKQGSNFLTSEIKNSGGVDFSRPILLGYTGLSDALLLKYMEDSRPLWQDRREKLDYTMVGSVVGTHAGPGGIAVAFFKKG